jgi:[ribosomal protein S5]-alanine N-acetyltransferase
MLTMSMPAFDQLTLRTERLALRPLREADAHALFALFSDADVMRYWSGVPWTDVARAHEMIAKDATAMRGGEHLRLGLARTDDGALIGTCTLFAFNAQCRRAELGYSLVPSVWGHGYMHEALAALLAYGFGELALNRVEADIDPRNTASARSLERLGFRQEGYLRERWIVADEVSDSMLYGLLQREWLARQAT